MGTTFHMNDTNRPLVAACDHWAANTENPHQIYFYSKETKTIHLLQFILHNVLAEAGSGLPSHIIMTKPCRMANSQNVAISGEISSAILNIWCRFIAEKVFEIINSQKSHANWICYDGWTPLDQPRFGFPVGEVPTCTWRLNSLLPIMTP